jgi:hypothetical protein
MNRQKKEWMKSQINDLDDIEHTQIYQIIMKYTSTFTKSSNGIFVSTEDLSEDCLKEVERHILFCLDQRKTMQDDMKKRKTLERMFQ